MRLHRLERSQFVLRPLEEVFEFFSRARNLELLTPPWLRFEITGQEPRRMRAGTLIAYRLRLHGVPLRWVSQIESWEPGVTFVDRQLHGPYRLWHHRHDFEARDGGTIVRDEVHYALALGPVGELADRLLVASDLERIFDFRRDAVSRLLG